MIIDDVFHDVEEETIQEAQIVMAFLNNAHQSLCKAKVNYRSFS
jgi:hypothetical protein